MARPLRRTLEAGEATVNGDRHPVVDVQGLTRVYGAADAKVEALRGVDLTSGDDPLNERSKA